MALNGGYGPTYISLCFVPEPPHSPGRIKTIVALKMAPASTAIRSKTNRKVLAAQEHAFRMGCRLNCFVTVHWEWTRFANHDRRAAIAKLRKMQLDWHRGKGTPFLDIDVREAPPPIGDRPSNGEHFHQATYVQADHWEDHERRIEEFLGCTAVEALVIKPINDRNLVRWYFMKAGTDAVRIANGIPDTKRFDRRQGKIVGPRVIISHSLNTKAIENALGEELTKEVRKAFAPKPISKRAAV